MQRTLSRQHLRQMHASFLSMLSRRARFAFVLARIILDEVHWYERRSPAVV